MHKLNTEDQVKMMYDSVTHKEYLAGVRTCERCGTEGKRLFRYTKTEVFCADCIVAAIKAREKGVRYSIKREGNKK
jgi:late competence protein required for DNA uptake (superfamily II DNA/RNA helicase)